MSSSAARPWLAWSCLAAVVIGCQALVSAALPRQRVVVMLPSSPDDSGLRDRFLQGFAIGEASVRACGHPLPTVRWVSLRPDQSPLEQLTHHSDQHLVVAPPSADLRAFSALSQHHGISVLLPYQRGESLDTLRGLKGRNKLWPLVPSIEDDVKATVEATLKAGWDRAMVVADPNSLEATLSTTFVDHYKALGGLVESYEPIPVQQVDPTDGQRLDRFRKDMNWSWAGTVVVADQPDGPLASRLRREQRDGAFGGGAPWTPNWVYLSDSDALQDLPQVPWQQLGWNIRPVVTTGWPLNRSSAVAGGRPPTCSRRRATTRRGCWRWWKWRRCRYRLKGFLIRWAGSVLTRMRLISAPLWCSVNGASRCG